MSNVYETCPTLGNETYMLRLVQERDAKDLQKVYGDKFALPFFNSDNCHGDNFYCPTTERMREAIRCWLMEYKNRGFVRFSIIERGSDTAIGTIELFNRVSEDSFNDCGILRLDVGSRYECEKVLCEILSIIIEPAYELFECKLIATKAPIYAVERIAALRKIGFEKSDEKVVGHDGTVYGDYWCICAG